jgi:hypothetical protein
MATVYILEVRRMEDRLPHIENKLYTFEANDTTEPSRLVVQFVGRCVQCVEQGKSQHVWKQMRQMCAYHVYRS